MKMLALSLQNTDQKDKEKSSNGLPTVNRSLSPNVHDVKSPFVRDSIQKQLNYSSFCGYDIKKDDVRQLSFAERLAYNQARSHRLNNPEQQVNNTVTNRDISRLKLLPNLDTGR